MTITAYGFAGVGKQMSDIQWARLHAQAGGAPEHTFGGGLFVSPTATARQVSIASGDAIAAGVLFSSSAEETLTVAANSSGSTRYDMIVAALDWGTKTVTLAVRQNVSTLASLTRDPGVAWDMPIALLTVANGQGAFATSQIVDLRPLGSGSIPLTAAAGWTVDGAKAVVSGNVVTLTGSMGRSGASVSLTNSLSLATVPARLNPPGASVGALLHVYSFCAAVGTTAHRRYSIPLQLIPGTPASTLTLWSPADVTPHFVAGTSSVNMSALQYIKGA